MSGSRLIRAIPGRNSRSNPAMTNTIGYGILSLRAKAANETTKTRSNRNKLRPIAHRRHLASRSLSQEKKKTNCFAMRDRAGHALLSLASTGTYGGRSGIEQLQIPGNVDDRNSLIAAHQEKQFENLGTLIVEWRLPPVFNDHLGNQDRDLAVGVLTLYLEDVFYQRHQDKAIGRG